MSQNELVFKSCDSYKQMLACATDIGKSDVSTAAWDLLRKPDNIVEIYRFDEEKLYNYLDCGDPTYIGNDTIKFFTKTRQMAFTLYWDENHFEMKTHGVYF